jgi:hypothetical protein
MRKALIVLGLVALAGCAREEKRVQTLVEISIPAEKMDCTFTGQRPALPPEHVIDWAKVQSVAQSRAEAEAYKKSVRAREAVVARYIVTVEGVAFACANDAEWIRDYKADVEAAHAYPEHSAH